MASLDSLPPDQRAVLQLVLQRGRSYDEIARLLSIDRAAVRARALAAFDALGPQTRVPPQRRALITDYLLGQLPPRVSDETRQRLSESASERAWARVISSELAPLASRPLPDIAVEFSSGPAPEGPPPRSEPRVVAAAPPRSDDPAAVGRDGAEDGASKGRSSRFGGAVLLAGAALVVVIVVIVLLSSGGTKKPGATTTKRASTPTTATTATSTTSGATVVAQINLLPTIHGSKAAGIAEVLREGATDGIAIVAQKMTPNTTHPPNAYAVWLYNSPTDAVRLGFVNPGVGANGRLSTAGALPANAAHFKDLIVTLETTSKPTTPGLIVLQGVLTGV